VGLRFYHVTSADGTRLNGWTNDADGPTVLLCNGLGTNPYAWPALLEDDCGVRVLSWNHRGVGGSDRPADRERVTVHDFVDDAVAVLDDAGVERCVVAGWSIGVNTQFELATVHPERVTGLFAVAGVPGGTFASMLAPLGVPRFVRRPLTVNTARSLRTVGKAVSPITTRLKVGTLATGMLRHSGFMTRRADPEIVRTAVREFLTTDVDWYMHLAVAAARHPRVSLSAIRVPTAFVAGRYDVLASAKDMATAAQRMTAATYTELPGSHFIQMEHPQAVHAELLELLDRVERTGPDKQPDDRLDPAATMDP
jgi:pimeloyl-ACP methyl ester carboxylesterase